MEMLIKSVLRGGGGRFDSYDRTPFCLNSHYFSCDLVLNVHVNQVTPMSNLTLQNSM